MESEALPEGLVESLRSPSAHPGDASATGGVDCIQTHMSWLFLTRDRVYKLHKAVELPFVSFASRTSRNLDALRELELNRRLTRGVYLGLAPLRASRGGFEVGPVAEDPDREVVSTARTEYCIVMRRLPKGCDGQELLRADALGREQLEATAALLVDFHQHFSLGAPAPGPREAWLDQVWSPVTDAIELAASRPVKGVEAQSLVNLREDARSRFDALRDVFEERRRSGRLADGHGDLQLAHLWFEESQAAPQIIDCIAFREDFRRVDVASELAFLAMDLRYRGRGDLAEHFLRCYARDADDFGLYEVVDFFAAYRAIVRGAVAAVAVADSALGEKQRADAAHSAREHLSLAKRLLAPAPPGALVAVCGTVGSGKSTAAAVLANALEGVAISSDRTRKRLAGLALNERGSGRPDRGIYTSDFTDRVYAGLLERAAPVVDSGRVVVLDATFARSAQRRKALDWASERGLQVLLAEIGCAEQEALERLRRREEEGIDVSDAGPAFYRKSVERYEEPAEWPAAQRIHIRTDVPGWRASLRAIALERVRRSTSTLDRPRS